MRYYVHITHTYTVDIPGTKPTEATEQDAYLSGEASHDVGNPGTITGEAELAPESYWTENRPGFQPAPSPSLVKVWEGSA